MARLVNKKFIACQKGFLSGKTLSGGTLSVKNPSGRTVAGLSSIYRHSTGCMEAIIPYPRRRKKKNRAKGRGNRLATRPLPFYSIYLGGNGFDTGLDLAVNARGQVCVTGYTHSEDFPTHQALQSAPGSGMDVFVTRLNATGNAFIYSTYLDGRGGDLAPALLWMPKAQGPRLECLNAQSRFNQLRHRAGQTIELPHHQGISWAHIVEGSFELRPVPLGARSFFYKHLLTTGRREGISLQGQILALGRHPVIPH